MVAAIAGITVVDETAHRLLLVEAPHEAIDRLKQQSSKWTVMPESESQADI